MFQCTYQGRSLVRGEVPPRQRSNADPLQPRLDPRLVVEHLLPFMEEPQMFDILPAQEVDGGEEPAGLVRDGDRGFAERCIEPSGKLAMHVRVIGTKLSALGPHAFASELLEAHLTSIGE